MGEPAGQHLFHGRVIVGSLDGLYFKFPVIVPLRTSVLEDYHGTNGLETADIGDIVGLHPADFFQSQPVSHLVHGADGPEFFSLDLILILVKHKLRVLLRKLHQSLFLAFFRDQEFYRLTAAFREPLCDEIHLRKFFLHPYLSRDKWSSRVELFYKASDDLVIVVCRGRGDTEMFPADHLSIPDKEYLHHSVRVVPRHGDHIPVFHAMARDLLLLGDLLHTV